MDNYCYMSSHYTVIPYLKFCIVFFFLSVIYFSFVHAQVCQILIIVEKHINVY